MFPGVLVVDQPHLPVDADEVLGQQIVVARHRRLGTHPHGGLELADPGLELLVAVGQAEVAPADDLEVGRLDLEHVEVLQEPPAAVETPARRGDRSDVIARAQLLRVHDFAVEVTEDEGVLLRESGDERCADPGSRRPRSCCAPRSPCRRRAGSCPCRRSGRRSNPARDLVVGVGEPAHERLDRLRGRAARERQRALPPAACGDPIRVASWSRNVPAPSSSAAASSAARASTTSRSRDGPIPSSSSSSSSLTALRGTRRASSASCARRSR